MENVTLRAIARSAGIAAPSIYRHFADLDAVITAVVDLAFVELEAQLHAACVGGSASARVRAVSRKYLSFGREHPHRYRVMFGIVWTIPDPRVVTAAERGARTSLGLGALRVLSAAIEECVLAGESRSADPTADATALWVGLHGLCSLRQTAPSFPWPSGLLDELVTSLARLRPAPGA